MSSLLPLRSDPATGDTEPRVVELEGEDADEVFGALSSDTARKIVAHLHEEPRTQSDLAEAVDTSVQNVRYHLDKLEDAGLVEVVDTWYSSRGNEMSVYAPADGALVIAGDRSRADRVRRALSQLIGGVVAVAAASAVVGRLVREGVLPGGVGAGAGGDDPGTGGVPVEDGGNKSTRAADATTTETVEATETAAGETARTATETTRTVTETTRTVTETTAPTQYNGEDGAVEVAVNATTTATGGGGDPLAAGAGGLPPEVLFFLGGVSVLAVVVGLGYLRG